MNQSYEIVIGLEVHIRLKTESKLFSSDANQYGAVANTLTGSYTMAHPGRLPMLNKEAIRCAIKLGLALVSRIADAVRFDRKHYFYPDSPKGYQITQDDSPICTAGQFTFSIGDSQKTISITQAHLEEDAGKLIHPKELDAMSLLDLNRAGAPLIELVTAPDFRSGEEIAVFLKELQRLVRFLDISDADMEKGSMRCDVNLSVRPHGSKELGTRCEIKNINSKRFAQKAIEYEANRQIALIESGQSIKQETRHFDAKNMTTYSSRNKEDAHDYRYYPDPDLPPILIHPEFLKEIKLAMPTLPWEAEKMLQKEHNLTEYQTEQISSKRKYFDLFITLVSGIENESKLLANLVINQIIPMIESTEIDIEGVELVTPAIHEYVSLIANKKINQSTAQQKLLHPLLKGHVEHVLSEAERLGLIIRSIDNNDMNDLLDKLVGTYPAEFQKLKNGKKALIGFFIGAAKKERAGIDIAEFNKAMTRKLDET